MSDRSFYPRTPLAYPTKPNKSYKTEQRTNQYRRYLHKEIVKLLRQCIANATSPNINMTTRQRRNKIITNHLIELVERFNSLKIDHGIKLIWNNENNIKFICDMDYIDF